MNCRTWMIASTIRLFRLVLNWSIWTNVWSHTSSFRLFFFSRKFKTVRFFFWKYYLVIPSIYKHVTRGIGGLSRVNFPLNTSSACFLDFILSLWKENAHNLTTLSLRVSKYLKKFFLFEKFAIFLFFCFFMFFCFFHFWNFNRVGYGKIIRKCVDFVSRWI